MYRGQGFGRGYRSLGLGAGWLGGGRELDNPYPYCRLYPWLPRRWWAYPASIQPRSYDYPVQTPSQPAFISMPLPAYNKEQERQMLMNQIQILEAQLKLTKKRLEELRG